MGDLFVTSRNTNSVLRYNGTTGAFVSIFVSAGSGGLSEPMDLIYGSDGKLYVSSEGTDEVLRYNGTTGAFDTVFASGGGPPALDAPNGLAFDSAGKLYVADAGNRVMRFNADGSYDTSFANPEMVNPRDVVIGPDGKLYVSCNEATGLTGQVVRFNLDGMGFTVFASRLGFFNGVAFGPAAPQDLYVGDQQGIAGVRRFNGSTGAYKEFFAAAGGLQKAYGLVFGPDNHLYVVSTTDTSVMQYKGTTGEFMKVFASGGGLDGPRYCRFMP